LGASVVEKHLTLDKNLKGPDHKASASPTELREFVTAVRAVETLLGSREKRPTKSELKYIPLVRKSVVAKKDVSKGEKFATDNLVIKRPGTGLPPRYFLQLLGKRAKRNITADTLLTKRDI
jgi:sialic acid synthase SpsE